MRRRELLVAGAAVALARPALAQAQGEPEEVALAGALQFEHATVLAYDALAAGLDGGARRLLRRLRAHEAAHAEALAKAMTGRGWRPPDPPRRAEEISFPQIRAAIDDGGPGAVAAIEALGLDVHAAAIGALRDAGHIQLAATILAAEASHVVAWRAVR